MSLRPLVALALAASTVLLSGCSDNRPGAAATVGGTIVSMHEVDDTTVLYCKAYLDTLAQGGQVIPMSLMRQYVAGSLAQKELGHQLATAYGVGTTPEYGNYMASVDQQFASKPSDVRDAATEVESGNAYLQSIELAIGQKLLGDEVGKTYPTSQAKKQLARGQQAAAEYVKSHPITTDPVLGITFDAGTFKASGDTGTSFAVSPIATGGQTSQPSADYVNALPASQRCGTGEASDQAGQATGQ